MYTQPKLIRIPRARVIPEVLMTSFGTSTRVDGCFPPHAGRETILHNVAPSLPGHHPLH